MWIVEWLTPDRDWRCIYFGSEMMCCDFKRQHISTQGPCILRIVPYVRKKRK